MNLPNSITLTRIALTPLFIVSMILDWNILIPFTIFAVASLTDGLDGYIARKTGQVTNFGKFIDPLADKILVSAALIMLLERGDVWGWAVAVILARDFVVTSLRLVAVDAGIVLAAIFSGKVKMVAQVFGILVMLTSWAQGRPEVFAVTQIVIVTVTVWSGIDYVWKNRRLFAAKKTN
ncbi:MAG: CDP-diacylglycerol--glycerol-3-phosphate 3-phosphatidyltransferase [Oscillospiraceae bacterium]|nr:CDP-diacylglycerol--glycerol-3-phosphate 3-phosphatidyltransferase [Oscillospiraceae bacterium]